jgi:hypothetical protein
MKKNVFIFIFGALFGVVAFIFFTIMHEDASNRIEAAQVLNDVSYIRSNIGEILAKKEKISAHFYSTAELAAISPNLSMMHRGEDGSLVFKSFPRGILFWLYPENIDGKVTWSCFGGSNKDVPVMCRKENGVTTRMGIIQ